MDCSTAVSGLLENVRNLPNELIDIIQSAPNETFLRRLSAAALDPKFGDDILIYFSPLFTEICGHWLEDRLQFVPIIAAFGRVLPHAPHLAEFAERCFSRPHRYGSVLTSISSEDNLWMELPEEELISLLLGFFRLLVFDNKAFSRHLDISAILGGLSNNSNVVRYLTVRILCLHLYAADATMETMLSRYVGGVENLNGPWDAQVIDYQFLSLWEEQRYQKLAKRLELATTEVRMADPRFQRLFNEADLCSTSALVAGILLPCLSESVDSHALSSDLVSTTITLANLRAVAEGLLEGRPLLLSGPAGSGKSALISTVARKLNKLDGMVTLHLNEQSDAKLLLGLYTSGSTPGTFVYKPGVLTTAVREGRWVLIEDLDRAPNEIISVLLPLIENGELLIPGRGEVISPARGFRLIATMRTVQDLRGGNRLAQSNMLGLRFWRQTHIQMLPDSELAQVVTKLHPRLTPLVSQFASIYSRLRTLTSSAAYTAQIRSGTTRAITPRDMLKWCRRIEQHKGLTHDFSGKTFDDIFLEALDCFAGYLPFGDALAAVASIIAEELHVDPSRRDYLIQSREIKLFLEPKPSRSLHIGRARISSKKSAREPRRSQQSFATNKHTLNLLEKIAVAVENKEPLLLVGETGTGKTTCIQYLAEQAGRKVFAFNLSQQSESSDLLGGFKPVNTRAMMIPLKDEFDELFQLTFSQKASQPFVEKLGKLYTKRKWKSICDMWNAALAQVDEHSALDAAESSATQTSTAPPSKRQKTAAGQSSGRKTLSPEYRARWKKFRYAVKDVEVHLADKSNAFAFNFIEGALVKAVRNGDWLLLDEINLASPDTLEALVDLLHDGANGQPSLMLTEAGQLERVTAHPDFRVFAAMNPATDVGKKDLPSSIRSRFTEIYVESPDRDLKSLCSIIESCLGENLMDRQVIADVADLYLKMQSMSKSHTLVDGAGQAPHFSLRTLTRSLSYAKETAQRCSLRRALYDGFLMSFSTLLDGASEKLLRPLILEHISGKGQNFNAELRKPIQKPADNHQYVAETSHWLRCGNFAIEEQPYYIITPFVRRNLDNLIRATSTRKYPILLQGPTSSGKTSMIEYLAKKTGNKFVRINNHEHTDLQEYLGIYVSDADGKLKFQEGVLVEALRNGHWIVLDELNLAPSDVLEALNRLLDDNRELLIPETQEIVRPHPDFMLFATQNPAGLYGGRKHLSRAFRNRFLELHFDDIPVDELCEILHRRTEIPESWARRIVDVYRELSMLRQTNRLFEQKSFATLRDLFRWALRAADTIEDLAVNGYMLLAERVRKDEERIKIKEVIEEVLSRRGARVRINEDALFSEATSLEIAQYNRHAPSSSVTWTRSMRRLFVLVSHALRNNEPVLLVGETGCGKTTVCQMLAAALEKQLFTLNAHQNTETGDLIGSQRPVRNRTATETRLREALTEALRTCGIEEKSSDLNSMLNTFNSLGEDRRRVPSELTLEITALRTRLYGLFEWHDGSLVEAMKAGQLFLLDEISLADDSVLERLNSVLESGRSLLLAEKGSVDSYVVAKDGFQFLATMNPGGDFGKKELSPALRNRFTEIWVPSILETDDILQILQSRLNATYAKYAMAIVQFAQFFTSTYNNSATSSVSVRDILSWADFLNCSDNPELVALLHGAGMVYTDTLGANPAALLSIEQPVVWEERAKCIQKLSELVGTNLSATYNAEIEISLGDMCVNVGPFSLQSTVPAVEDGEFSFDAIATRFNTLRVFRALQLSKPILIEGNPGVGKTALVSAIAKLLGKHLTRINLSEQTDLMDLFGSDVPVEDAKAGTFAWRDAPFLQAMKAGHWVLLDEMNLASQPVLEGLNACLDHRGEAYVSELNQTFRRHPDFRIFAAQNPHSQGGGRKGLPASFVNRFTVVYANAFMSSDLEKICKQLFPESTEHQLNSLTRFVDQLNTSVNSLGFGTNGGPWEVNLRDSLRWLRLTTSQNGLLPFSTPYDCCDVVFRQRFRSRADKAAVDDLFGSRFLHLSVNDRSFYHNIDADTCQVGIALLKRSQLTAPTIATNNPPTQHLKSLESLMVCVQQAWPVILVGASGSGKTTLIKHLASVTGQSLVTLPLNPDIDATDLVGGFEQTDPHRQRSSLVAKLHTLSREELLKTIASGDEASCDAHTDIFKRTKATGTSDSDVLAYRDYLVKGNEGSLPEDGLLSNCQDALARSETIEQAQFQWVDGQLIRAIEEGQWLVLDNANLCSSSVLDRLNSLLEPNGFLSINEHAGPNGEARVVRPHANFRIFLTMDPRHGELSRAMRNRAVEIFIESPDQMDDKTVFRGCESKMYRYRHFLSYLSSSDEDDRRPEIPFDHLSFDDQQIFSRFLTELRRGLISISPKSMDYFADMQGFLGLLDRGWASSTLKWYEEVKHLIASSTQVSKTSRYEGCLRADGVTCSQFIHSIMKLFLVTHPIRACPLGLPTSTSPRSTFTR